MEEQEILPIDARLNLRLMYAIPDPASTQLFLRPVLCTVKPCEKPAGKCIDFQDTSGPSHMNDIAQTGVYYFCGTATTEDRQNE